MTWYSTSGTKPPLNKLLVFRESNGIIKIGKLRVMNQKAGTPKGCFYCSDKGRVDPSQITHWLLLPEFPAEGVPTEPTSSKGSGVR